ncbi:MAG TPA: hypothetical protein VFM86_15260 [Pedococcus sp.]|nr:hypothetical protein [Pedococcus sp.]
MPTSPVIVSDLTDYQSGDPQTLIYQATALVRSYCGWHVSPSATDTVTVMGSGRPSILLPSLYVTAVSAVTEDGVTLTGSDFVWDASGIVGRVGVPWTTPDKAVTVTFTHGYDQAGDFAAVILAVASRAQASPDGVVRRQAGLVSETYSQTGTGTAGGVSLLPHEKDILRAYRIPRTP